MEIASQEYIAQGVKDIATAILAQPSMTPDVVVPLLLGGLTFAADLVRALYPQINPVIWPIKTTKLPGIRNPEHTHTIVQNTWLSNSPYGGIRGKRVLIVDVIFETGSTIEAVKSYLADKTPRSVLVATLLWRNLEGSKGKPHYYAFDLKGDKRALYGYGLAKDQRGRGASGIYA